MQAEIGSWNGLKLTNMSQAVDYFDAWQFWADGADIRDMRLWDVPIFWWARIGKIFALISGAVLVVELIGPKRLASMSVRDTLDDARLFSAWFAGGAVALVLFVPTGMFVSLGVFGTIDTPAGPPHPAVITAGSLSFFFGMVTSAALVANKFMLTARVTSLLFLLVGFHFDLLAS